MRFIIISLIMSAFGAGGWMLGSPLGIYGSLVVSMIGSGGGLYAGRRLVEEFMP